MLYIIVFFAALAFGSAVAILSARTDPKWWAANLVLSSIMVYALGMDYISTLVGA